MTSLIHMGQVLWKRGVSLGGGHQAPSPPPPPSSRSSDLDPEDATELWWGHRWDWQGAALKRESQSAESTVRS